MYRTHRTHCKPELRLARRAMELASEYKQPANPFHPGEILLEEFLEPAGTTQAAFSRTIGWTKSRLNELIKGKRGITADAALDLAAVLGSSPRLWMNLQTTYDLAQAEKRRRPV